MLIPDIKEAGSPFRAVIGKQDDSLPRPTWSVMIPAFNCYNYITQTLTSVLEQDPGPDQMQIEVVDDNSYDGDLENLVFRVGKGRINYFRQSKNVGHIRNFDTCLNRSLGKLVHLLHGDDYVKPGFYHKIQSAFQIDKEIGAAFTGQIFIDSNGKFLDYSTLEQEQSGRIQNHLEVLSLEQRIMTPSIVVRRDVYEKLGGFDNRLVCSEDWEMWIRIAANYPIWYETEPLAVYRIHNQSNTGRHIHSADDIAYTRMAINIFKDYLPSAKSDYITSRALSTYARSAIDTAVKMLWEKDKKAFRSQFREALRCSSDNSVYFYFIRSFFKHFKRTMFNRINSQ